MTLDSSQLSTLGDYDILSKIAEGGMGAVYKARHRHSGAIVAIKIISKDTARNPVLLQRFKQEFDAARLIDHPNVVRALEYHSQPQPYIVMEYVDGESVGQRLQRRGPFDEQEAIRLIAQVCEGLHRAHKQGLVHRDVKPDNILITREGQAKLTDLGLVKDIEADLNLTRTGRGLGTPHYMAPEQFRNAKNVDVRSDIYSLGATLYAMVTGVTPFENTNPLDCWMRKIRNEFPGPRELNPRISERVDWAIRRAMSAEPERRPASCREFLEDLTGQSRTATRTSPSGKLATGTSADLWYMVYKDEQGVTHTVKGTTDGIRRALQDRLLGDPTRIFVSRQKTGPFTPLGNVTEFRDLVVNPAPLEETGRRSGVVRKPNGGSGSIPAPSPHADSDPEAINLGGTPSPELLRSNTWRPSPSGRLVSPSGRLAGSSGTTAPASSVKPLVEEPGVDPHAETVAYTPVTATPPEESRLRTPATAPKVRRSPPPTRPRWTITVGMALALVLIAAVAAGIGYIIFTR
ncbi:MAG: protein kinase [Gemmataceae bacterium]|nr:protein kinase [Gemmataceae bacterium]